MCGIFGQLTPNRANPELIHQMAQCIAHRGPDGYDIVADKQVAFGAGRLAIVDLSAPAGPIFNEDQRIGVAFNGEIYNHRTLRDELIQQGHIFKTETDTEVIVHGYEAWGRDVLNRLQGMFAFCIYDREQQRLLLARDRMGEKPLYYLRRDDGELIFASEIKAILLHADIHAVVNHSALPYYLTLGYVPPPMTMYEGIQKLEAGCYLDVTLSEIQHHRYWRASTEKSASLDYEPARKQVESAVREAVDSRMMSDVPIGALLSGGVDSAGVVALMQEMSDKPVNTFTVGFDFETGSYGDAKFNVDLHYAKEVATYLGTDHRAITIQDAFVPEMLPHLVYHLDEPIAQHSIIQTAYVTALARHDHIPVLLSGDGSDELFLGYDHYRADQKLAQVMQLPALVRHQLIKPLIENFVPRYQDYVPKLTADDPSTRYLEWMRFMRTDEAKDLMAHATDNGAVESALQGVLSPLLAMPQTDYFAERIGYTSLNLWIPEDSNMRVDKMSMMMSVETRAPLEDHHLVDFVLGLPFDYKLRDGSLKHILKDALRDYLPQGVFSRPKWGFIPPTSDWLRTNLTPLVDTYLSYEYVSSAGMCRPDVVQRLVQEHRDKTGYHLKPLWALLILHLWHAIFIEKCLVIDAPLTAQTIVENSHIERS